MAWCVLLPAVAILPCYSAKALDRPADPVVLTGAQTPGLVGIAPGDLVAFRYADGWEQIPVQVDERALINFTDV